MVAHILAKAILLFSYIFITRYYTRSPHHQYHSPNNITHTDFIFKLKIIKKFVDRIA